jgi:hypothetical protein
MVSESRLEKGEQLVKVATHNPTTTPDAARNRKDGRAGSMTCTIILIQKSNQRAQPAERDEPSLFGLFGLFG